MTLKVRSLKPTIDVKELAEKSQSKGASVTIDSGDGIILLLCKAYGRILGSMIVSINNGVATITQKRIIEQDFYPYEAMYTSLIPLLKRRRIKELKA